MTKRELISKMADDSGITRKDTEKVLNAFISEVTLALKKKEQVRLFDLGTFLVKKRKARNGRNPKTGEIIKIKARMVPVFRPAKALREAVKDVH